MPENAFALTRAQVCCGVAPSWCSCKAKAVQAGLPICTGRGCRLLQAMLGVWDCLSHWLCWLAACLLEVSPD